ncbi:MAG: hypothetical protein ACE5IB_07615 [Candidatus Geothermarchaeales archaeon]
MGRRLRCGIDPLNVDTDGDCLKGHDELRVEADPLHKDPDGDVWPDAGDISPNDPLIPNAEITISALLLGVAAIYVRRIRNPRQLCKTTNVGTWRFDFLPHSSST